MTQLSINTLCTVIVCSCDKYADLLGPFSELWRKFWPDCPFETCLVTETAPEGSFVFDRIISCGTKTNWCERLVEALGQITTPYILMLCDDYYLFEKVETKLVLGRLNQIHKYNASNLRMIPNPRLTRTNSLEFSEDQSLRRYRNHTAYSIATQAGFWNREFLLNLARGKGSIWEFERYGSFDPISSDKTLLVTVKKEFPFLDAVHKGHWEQFGLNCCLANKVDLSHVHRTLPPLKTRLIEGTKAILFRILPTDLLVRIQNRFALGAK